jgi:predicted HD phosphohydrolase
VTAIDTIFDTLRAGQKHYGESAVTQLEHAIQCAMLAEREGAGAALVVASLLHDFGHLVNPDDRAAASRGEDGEHEHVAADYLARWFGDEVILPIRLHVAAKRYLTATEPGYAGTLSRASVLSLAAQERPVFAGRRAALRRTPGCRRRDPPAPLGRARQGKGRRDPGA